MSDFVFHSASHTCRCTPCVLVRCNALPDDWPDWREVEFSGDLRVLMCRLTGQLPMLTIPPGPWVGERPWFDLLGLGLDFGGTD